MDNIIRDKLFGQLFCLFLVANAVFNYQAYGMLLFQSAESQVKFFENLRLELRPMVCGDNARNTKL